MSVVDRLAALYADRGLGSYFGEQVSMLEHGLPVLVNRDDVHYPGWLETGYSPLLIKMAGNLPERLASARRASPRRILPDVARQFLDDLVESAQQSSA